ncbi:MAG: DNA repair protein RadC [Clostridia bacterium]|nr:DNA repair protein RadC [Clostridia bacterium]
MSGNGDIHAGHRQRMKERFLANGLEGFSQHEAIELMLYYAIPRRDVNELSHRLIERFGSYNAVFDADYEDLLSVEGIGENAAILFKLMAASWRKYALNDGEKPFLYDSPQKIGNYAARLFIGASVEKLYVMLFDNKMMLLDTVKIAEGAVNSVSAPPRVFVEKAFKKNAASIVLIHNHPSGLPNASDDDICFTHNLKSVLKGVGIDLIDHVIVSGKYYKPIFGGLLGESHFASRANFAYDPNLDSNDIREADLAVAADVPYKGDKDS